MSMRSLIPLALAVALTIGCQSPRMNAHVELMNAEKRALEDELYELEFDYEDAVRELEWLRKENERLKQGLGPSTRSEGPRIFGSDRSKSSESSSGPELRPPTIDEGTLSEPKVEMPDEKSATEGTLPAPNPPRPALPRTPGPSVPKSSSNDSKGETPVANKSWSLEPADPRITHIHLNPLLTGGGNFDQQPGDDGISVVIEPRNTENDFVPLAGPVSVVVLDPTKEGQVSRVARWDLDATETERLLETSTSGRGIRLRLPWPKEAPANSRLMLFVRYITLDGRKLEANREIFITLPGQFSQRWTPRSTPRNSAEKETATASTGTLNRNVPASSVEKAAAGESSVPNTRAVPIPVTSDPPTPHAETPEKTDSKTNPGTPEVDPSESNEPGPTSAPRSPAPPSPAPTSSAPEWRPYRAS